MRKKSRVSESDMDNDFEYNFDVTPFNLILDGVHWLVVTTATAVKKTINWAADRLHTIQKEQNYRRTFKGPVCLLK